jgi:hypothetical protein
MRYKTSEECMWGDMRDGRSINCGRHGLHALLASGVLAMIADGVAVPAEEAENHILIRSLRLSRAEDEEKILVDVEFKTEADGKPWKWERFELRDKQNVAWLTGRVGIDVSILWFKPGLQREPRRERLPLDLRRRHPSNP